MKIEKKCTICGSSFYIYPYQENRRRTCSVACAQENKKVKWAEKRELGIKHKKPRKSVTVQKTCANPNCGRTFNVIPCKAGKQRFCSLGCNSSARIKRPSKSVPPNQNHRGGRVRAVNDVRLKKEPEKMHIKPIDIVTPWYRVPGPGNMRVQTKNPKPGYIPINTGAGGGQS